MATLDSARQRARLDPDELAAATLLLADRDQSAPEREPPQAVLARLDRAGAIESDGLAGWLAELLAPVAGPELQAVAEVHSGAEHAIVAIAWCRDGKAVFGRLAAGGETELAAIEPAALPAAIGVEVGLVPRPVAPGREPISASHEEVQRAYDGTSTDALGQVMAARVRSWRVTASGRNGTRAVGVLDAGQLGLWLSEPGGEDGEGVALVPTDAETIINGLLALLADQLLVSSAG